MGRLRLTVQPGASSPGCRQPLLLCALLLLLVPSLEAETSEASASTSFSLRRLQGLTITTTSTVFETRTITSTTYTTTVDPCPGATTSCACADGRVCAWATAANGGGKCFKVAQGGVDCFSCPQQSQCASESCSPVSTPCSCAATYGCRWDTVSDACVQKTSYGTPCDACPSQLGCSVDPPRAVTFQPQKGGSSGAGQDLQIKIWFSTTVKWCEQSPLTTKGPEMSFWCDGMALDEDVSRSRAGVSSSALTVDMTWLLSTLTRSGPRNCGLAISSGTICDLKGAGFPGLAKGAYSFRLTDAEPPQLIDFDPSNGGAASVPMDGHANLLYSEPIVLNPAGLSATLSRLEMDSSGTTSIVQSYQIPLKSPGAEIISSSVLRIYLSGKLRSGLQYTLALPAGAVVDLAGNSCRELPANVYSFRAATAALRIEEGYSDSGTSVGLVILAVCLTVAFVLGVTLGFWRLYKANATRIAAYLKHEGDGVRQMRQIPPPVMASAAEKSNVYSSMSSASGRASDAAKATAAAESAYRSATAAAERIAAATAAAAAAEKPSATGSGAKSTNGSASHGTWAQRTMPGGPRPTSSAPGSRVHPSSEGPGRDSSKEKRRSSGGAAPGGNAGPSSGSAPGQSATPQEDTSGATPEVKVVEKQLRALMDKPLAERKKAIKDLLVEFHPDKNSAAHAKEVFQYVNNARAWFLVEI